jgi:rod shape determining protein RodA
VRIRGKERNVQVWIALAGFVLLAGIGLVNLRNADLYSQDQYHYSQIIWILIGGVGAVIAAKIDFIIFERLAWVVYGGSLVLLLAVLLVGREVNNSTRWIELFGITMQPSEPAKLGVILALASYFQRSKRTERYTLRSLWKPFLIIAVPAALIIVEPDLGTTLSVVFVGASVILFAGVRTKSLLLLAGWIGLAVPIAWQTDIILPYQKDRVALWLNPDQFKWDENRKERLDKNMQPEQALWAIGSGRLVGKGGGQGSRSRLKVLPEMQTDFVLATFAEERGFVGCFFLVALYYALVVWGLGVARDARDRFSALVATGVSFLLFWQTFMNVGMVTGVLPVVGITLPFMSYGGSSMLTSAFGIGMLFNVALHMRRR